MGETRPTGRTTHAEERGRAHTLRAYVPLALVKGFAGAACVWSWALAAFLLAGRAGALAGAMRLAVVAGLLATPLLFTCLRALAHRGPEFGRRTMVVASGAASAAVLISALLGPGPGAATGNAGWTLALAAPWFFSAVFAAYGLRRSYNLVKNYLGYWSSDDLSLQTVLGVALAAVLFLLVQWRMDPVASLVATCALVPASLWLLPQGRLMLGPGGDQCASAMGPGDLAAVRSDDASRSVDAAPAPDERLGGVGDDCAQDAARPGETPSCEAAPDGALRETVLPEAAPAAPAAATVPATRIDRGALFDDLAVRYGLSERERGLLPLLADGLNAQQIAERVFVSRNTAKTHMAHIYQKMGVHTRAELDLILGSRR